ncbi:hypothetical protein N7463_008856 [Penicillium fimorum]|uniref:Uncharacterized protein n=1 Tax=Penicillium fimorum TaxID=1882269 RepID=A0A9X0C465_9EURO|nr:hypothetical protein N7463_008856 [Penicillium fimorum]
MPPEFAEWINPGGERSRVRHSGKIRSLFWLVKLDVLVKAIDDPAFTITDEIRVVPQEVSIIWILYYLFEEGKEDS